MFNLNSASIQQPPETRNIVIIGAGVIGLTIAHVLSTRHPNTFKITIVARDMPDDMTSQAFASPFAGANWSPFGYEEKSYNRERVTFNKLWDMQSTGLVHILPTTIYSPEEPTESALYFKDLVRNFKRLAPEQLPQGMAAGVTFDTISVNPEEYLPWLKSELVSFGVTFLRRKLQSLNEAAEIAGTNGVIFNATALGARSLIGVEDINVHPIRGQTILVHAPEIKECMESVKLPLESAEFIYIIPRPSPHGHVLVGGTYQKDNWDTSVDFHAAQKIWDSAVQLMPRLKTDETKVICHNVGLRPAREGGPRIELESVSFPVARSFMHGSTKGKEDFRLPVLHAYGFGGAGYQGSWGAAEEAVDLLKNIL